MGYRWEDFKYKCRNAYDASIEGGQLAIKTACRANPLTVIPVILHQRYARGEGWWEAANPLDDIWDAPEDYIPKAGENAKQIKNQQLRSEVARSMLGNEFASGKGYYHNCVKFNMDVYEMGMQEAATLCYKVHTGGLSKEEFDNLVDRNVDTAVAAIKLSEPTILKNPPKISLSGISLPSLPDINLPSLPDLKLPSLGIAKYIFLFILIIIGLIALGYSGVGGIMEREHGRKRG